MGPPHSDFVEPLILTPGGIPDNGRRPDGPAWGVKDRPAWGVKHGFPRLPSPANWIIKKGHFVNLLPERAGFELRIH